MGKFADTVWFEIEHCCNCGMAFAMPLDFQRRRLDDHASFYCPAGHRQHYTGKTEAQKLRDKLVEEQARTQREADRAARVTHERDRIAKAHRKMRIRVANGVCPCCNRSFDNLRQHMQTQHADFGSDRTLRALRQAFGMTQQDVADEAYVNPAYVSLFERSKPVPSAAAESLNWWIEHNASAA